MSFWGWIAIVVGVVVLFALLFFVVGTPSRRREAKRKQAEALRQEADQQLKAAAEREATARQEKAAAERERLAAERKIDEADGLDPDLPSSQPS